VAFDVAFWIMERCLTGQRTRCEQGAQGAAVKFGSSPDRTQLVVGWLRCRCGEAWLLRCCIL